MESHETLVLSPNSIVFLANTAVAATLAAGICVLLTMALSRSSAPVRYGVLLCGLVLLLLAPVIALVGNRSRLGQFEVGIENANRESASPSPFVDDSPSPPKPAAIPYAPSHLRMPPGKSADTRAAPLENPKAPIEIAKNGRDTPDRSLAGATEPPPVSQTAETPDPRTDFPRWIGSLFGFAWLAGSAAGLLWLIWACLRISVFRRTLKENDSESTQRLADAAADRLNLPFRPRVAESNRITSPVAFGLFRPVIVLPSGFVAQYKSPQLEGILIHEMAHIRRRDTLIGLARKLAAVLFWWSPPVYLLNRRLALLCEEICDNHVARCQGDGEEFAALLVEMAERMVATDQWPATVGLFESSRGGIEYRVRRLLTLKADAPTGVGLKAKGLMAVFGMLLAAAILFVNVRAADKQRDDEGLAVDRPIAPSTVDRVDRYGDALPGGALARLGTIRLRHAGLILSVELTVAPNRMCSRDADRPWFGLQFEIIHLA